MPDALPPSRALRVVMIGPPATGQGGVASVVAVLGRHAQHGVHVRCIPTFRDGSAMVRITAWLLGWARVTALLLTGRVDLLHAHVSERGSVLRKSAMVLLAGKLGVPTALHCHGAEFVEWFQRLRPWLRAMIAATFRSADVVLVLSPQWRLRYVELLGLDPSRVHAVGNPAELPPPRTASTDVPGEALEAVEGEDAAPLTVLFLGRFGSRKGSARVLHAMAQQRRQAAAGVPRLRLRMAGDGEVAATRELASTLALDVEVSDWIDPQQRDAALRAADVFVLPSRDEGLPMALLEAMGHGLVPVVSPVGSIPELIVDGRNGLLVPADDVAGLAAALDRLAKDPEVRHRLAAAARQSVLPFSAERYCHRIRRLWTELAADSNTDSSAEAARLAPSRAR